MQISQDDVDSILEQARRFYKAGGKSTNKRYDIANIPNPTEKHTRRNEGRDEKTAARNAFRTDAKSARMTWAQVGQEIIVRNHQIGNCAEMSAVAVHLCIRRLSGRYGQMYIGHLRHPGDHNFVVLSIDGSMPPWTAILAMRGIRDNNFWVIDCWANIACPAMQYPNELNNKIKSWSEQMKQVRSREHTWVDPNSGSYKTALLASALGWYSPYRLM
jgi:hypothetical protein